MAATTSTAGPEALLAHQNLKLVDHPPSIDFFPVFYLDTLVVNTLIALPIHLPDLCHRNRLVLRGSYLLNFGLPRGIR